MRRLQAPVQGEGPQGPKSMSGGKQNKLGTPQGGVISPLLANRYMNRFLRHWRQCEGEKRFSAKLVNYADDFVILSKGKAQQALAWTRQVMTRLKLEINETSSESKFAVTGGMCVIFTRCF
jgi:RNA-directed DNA polymerase